LLFFSGEQNRLLLFPPFPLLRGALPPFPILFRPAGERLPSPPFFWMSPFSVFSPLFFVLLSMHGTRRKGRAQLLFSFFSFSLSLSIHRRGNQQAPLFFFLLFGLKERWKGRPPFLFVILLRPGEKDLLSHFALMRRFVLSLSGLQVRDDSSLFLRLPFFWSQLLLRKVSFFFSMKEEEDSLPSPP